MRTDSDYSPWQAGALFADNAIKGSAGTSASLDRVTLSLITLLLASTMSENKILKMPTMRSSTNNASLNELQQLSALMRRWILTSTTLAIKPLDVSTLEKASTETGAIIVVEDHFAEGGIGEPVRSSLAMSLVPIHHLAVHKRPQSGSPERMRKHHAIDASAIVTRVQQVVQNKALLG